jgi:adenylate kinase
MAVYIVLLGPPGAGKGTQAKAIAEHTSLPHISSGAILRENIRHATELGKKAEVFIVNGDLVPDNLTISMVEDRLERDDCIGGALLDGFPRTPAQADALAKYLKKSGNLVNAVPYIKVPEEELIKRLSGRLTCREKGHIFHIDFNPPQNEGVCDFDGSELYQREDDNRNTVKNRIEVYFEQTRPLIEYYEEKGVLVEIDGTRSIEEVTEALLSRLKSRV